MPPRRLSCLPCQRLLGAAGLLLASASAPVLAQTVAWAGAMGDRVLLVIDGRPQVASAGHTVDGVKVLRVGALEVEFEVAGVRQRLSAGGQPVVIGGAPSRAASSSVVLRAGADHLYRVDARINGQPAQGVIDTGASLVAMSASRAASLGLDWSQGAAVQVQTANGRISGWQIRVPRMAVGGLEARDVEAVVLDTELPHLLVGNSFLRRFSVRTQDSQLTLARL